MHVAFWSALFAQQNESNEDDEDAEQKDGAGNGAELRRLLLLRYLPTSLYINIQNSITLFSPCTITNTTIPTTYNTTTGISERRWKKFKLAIYSVIFILREDSTLNDIVQFPRKEISFFFVSRFFSVLFLARRKRK